MFCVAAFSSCTKSILIRPSDAAFVEAQAKLACTAELVAAATVSEPERQLFMQAESFYRYRFEPPARSPGMYIAQAAAVAAELPALQAFSGSLDLNDLKLKAYDGAVHLWESLLMRFPRTRLRPLTLYRLGWAYRSTGVSGLPREDGDEAFRELLSIDQQIVPPRLVADALHAPWKSKDAASAWSVIPGAAHFYVGEYKNGSIRLAVALAAAVAILWPTVKAVRRRDELTWQHDWPLLVSGFVGFTVLSIDYTSSYEDAMRAVVDFNEYQEQVFRARHPDEP